jgi:hypothetical protein
MRSGLKTAEFGDVVPATRRSLDFPIVKGQEAAMATLEDVRSEAKRLLVPGAASLVGAGAGLVLTRKPVRKALPNLGDLDVRDVVDDLKDKVSSFASGQSPGFRTDAGSDLRKLEPSELERRRTAREGRRAKRRERS